MEKSTAVHHEWNELIGEWLEWSELAGASTETVRARGAQARHLAKEAGVSPVDVDTDLLVAFFADHEWKPQTKAAYRANLGSFFGRLVERGIIACSPVAAIPKVLKALRIADERTGRMIRLGAECGLRRGEIARVRGDDVLRDACGFTLRVHGKGGRYRVVPLSDELAAELTEHGDGWVFASSHGGHLHPRYVNELLNRVLPEGFGPHSLRHRYASRVYAETGDILMVSTLLGHSSVTTTQIYCRIPDKGLHRAAASARLPR